MKPFLIIIILLASFINLKAENRYALLVGINNYIKPDAANQNKLCRESIKDLPACENDVTMIIQLLIGKYAFQQVNIQSILNEQATRDNIIQALTTSLAKGENGDIFFFYFAGHGSQMKNSLSTEPDQMDETIVPSDGIYRGKDIRDKELARIFKSFLDKGILITAVFESCHSGSIARGLGFTEERLIASTEVVADAGNYPQPEKNGALIISASQDFQSAYCISSSDGNSYSLFTKAFVEVAKRNPAEISAQDLCNTVIVQLKNMGATQIPTIAANNLRRNTSLFSNEKTASTPFCILVEKMLADKTLLLQGGTALGLESGTELQNESRTIKIEITGNPDLTKSIAKVISGNPLTIKSSSRFYISKYAYRGENKLRVSIPAVTMKRGDFIKLNNRLANFIAEKNLLLTSTNSDPVDYWVYFNESNWYMISEGKEKDLGEILNFDSLSLFIQYGKTIFIQLPSYTELTEQIKALFRKQYSCIELSSFGNADYYLSGTMNESQLSYSLVKTHSDSTFTETFPPQSKQLVLDTLHEDQLVAEIASDGWKLSRMKAWLNLENEKESDTFPFDVSLKNPSTRQMIGGGIVKEGDQYQLYLVKNASIRPEEIKRRWVYIFVISEDGSIHLLFPQKDRGNIENFLPIDTSKEEERIFADVINVTPPFGVDNIICLTSAEPLQNPRIIEQAGVTSRSVNQNPLEDLVMITNARTRSATTVKAPAAWSIQKIRFRSVPK